MQEGGERELMLLQTKGGNSFYQTAQVKEKKKRIGIGILDARIEREKIVFEWREKSIVRMASRILLEGNEGSREFCARREGALPGTKEG